MKIAVLLATYNRKQKTLTCLDSVKKQRLNSDIETTVFLTDDASTDGTADAVARFFPDVKLIKGTGSLFWAGGMRSSWGEALAYDPDFYLLLNDDTTLTEDAFSVLLKCVDTGNNKSKPAICIGSTVDQGTGKISYGGRKLNTRYAWDSYLVHSETEVLECDLGNANIMLVPRAIVQQLGILSDVYTHSLADYDYTLKAKEAGFRVLSAPGFLGTCVDDHGNNWKSNKVKLKERISYLKSPKGLAYKEYLKFISDHFPLSYPSAFCKLWMKTFFPFLWDTFKK